MRVKDEGFADRRVVVGYEVGLGGQSSYEYLMSPHLTRPQGERVNKNTVKLNLFVFRPVQLFVKSNYEYIRCPHLTRPEGDGVKKRYN